ncbi:MAG: hypothetical protein ACSHYC_09725 [Alphaproteobacteria bacterium]
MTNKAREFRNHSISLQRALDAVPPKDIVRKYQELDKQSSLYRHLEKLPKELDSGVDFLDYVKGMSATAHEALEVRRQLEQFVMKYIKNGQLVATGFSVPRHPSDEPEFVPQDILSFLNWEGGYIRAKGYHIVEIRLSHRSWMKQTKQQPNSPKTGRPSLRPEIKKAFDALDVQGKIEYHCAMKRNNPAVRRFVVEKILSPNDDPNKGLDDQTISAVINPLIKNRLKTKN